MTELEHKYAREFLQIATENGYCHMVCFSMGALAFNVGTDEKESVARLKDLIELAKRYPEEKEFMSVVCRKYFN